MLNWPPRKSNTARDKTITNGTPNAMLEAMTIRAQPIQSETIPSLEFVTTGRSAPFVDPEGEFGLDIGEYRRAASEETREKPSGQNRRPAVLVATQLFPAPGNAPFSGLFVVQQLKALSRYFDVVVLVPHRAPWIPRKSDWRTKKVVLDGVKVVYIPIRPSLGEVVTGVARTIFVRLPVPILFDERSARYAENVRFKESVAARIVDCAKALHRIHSFVLVHGQEVVVGDEAANIGDALGIPSVVTLHSLFDFAEDLYGPRCMSSVVGNLERVSAVVTVSERARQSYVSRLKNDVTVIPNGFAFQPLGPVPQSLRDFAAGRRMVLFAGFLIPSKRVDLLVEAFSRITPRFDDGIRLVVIGRGPLEHQLRRRVRQIGIERQVWFVGEVHPADMPAFYSVADIVVQPSINESFSMICLEAMAFGKPFICTTEAGIAEYVTHGKEALVVRPDNLDDLVASLTCLLENESLRKQMGRLGLNRSKHFAWDRQIKKTVRLYERLLSRQGNR